MPKQTWSASAAAGYPLNQWRTLGSSQTRMGKGRGVSSQVAPFFQTGNTHTHHTQNTTKHLILIYSGVSEGSLQLKSRVRGEGAQPKGIWKWKRKLRVAPEA